MKRVISLNLNEETSIVKEEITSARAKLIEIKASADALLKTYINLYKDLNELYDRYPRLYEKFQQTVDLPTNDDADTMKNFHDSLNQQLEYFKDDAYLFNTLNDRNPY